MVKRFFKGKFIYGEVVGIDKNGLEIFEKVCDKCNGTGKLQHYNHNDNGICYKCMGNGKGKIIKGTKEMTDEETKEEVLKVIREKKRKKNQFCDDEMIDKWRKNETLEYLIDVFRI